MTALLGIAKSAVLTSIAVVLEGAAADHGTA
jgi:hypothetical protein